MPLTTVKRFVAITLAAGAAVSASIHATGAQATQTQLSAILPQAVPQMASAQAPRENSETLAQRANALLPSPVAAADQVQPEANGGLPAQSANLVSAGLTITPTFDTSITSDPNAAAIEGAINNAIAIVQSQFADPITVQIKFTEGGGLGSSSKWISNLSYATFLAALKADATTVDDATAMSLLPAVSTNPVNHQLTINATLPNFRAVGIATPPTPDGFDGTITLNTSLTNPGSPSSTLTYNLLPVVLHEIDEVLGLGSALPGVPNGTILPEDLYRYSAQNIRTFTTTDSRLSGVFAYFSIDATTSLAEFDNQNDGGDFGDWQSYPALRAGVSPKVQDAFATPGANPLPSVELTALDVIGYDRVANPLAAPVVIGNPANLGVTAGQVATFTAAASGTPTPTVQWQVSSGGGFVNISGATSTTYSFTTTLADNGKMFRAIFTNALGSATSAPATLTVNVSTAPTVTQNPASLVVNAGAIASFTSAASGTPAPTVQWQLSVDAGLTWGNIGGATTTTYSFATAASDNGKRFRAVFTNAAGAATSAAATLTVDFLPTATVNPATLTVALGQQASFSASVSGNPSPTILWESSIDNGATWFGVSGASGALYSFAPVASNNGNQYRVVVSNALGTVTSAPATLTVTLPTMTLDRSALVFTAVDNGTAFTAVTAGQAVRMTQSGGGTVLWSATPNQPWLVVSPQVGSGSATLNVSTKFVPGLAATQPGSITIALTGAASNTAGPITVVLNAIPPASAQPPFGSFDTPSNGATGVAGSIPVTGWALDRVQVTRVTVCRDAFGSEVAPVDPNCAGNAQIYIGDGVFIDGARPDVQAANSTLPLSSRAGWGYLMLTNFLPNLGNGTFNLRAYAFDVEGLTTLLGVRTITCSNAGSFAPFGAIDTPAQGAVTSGQVNNFGWVLAQSPNFADPPQGGTVNVFVDGANVGSPGGWTTRSDLQSLFVPASTYPGVGNALAVFGLDTTTLANGLHSIAWSVTGSPGGGTSGIGSRFFSVSNGAELVTPAAATSQAAAVIASRSTLDIPAAAASRLASGQLLVSEIAAAPPDLSAVQGRRGFDLDLPLRTYTPSSGSIAVQAEELDRIELHLSTTGNHHYTGYLQTSEGPRPLPVGSSLDASSGTFTWMPGVGFYGTYNLTFVRWSGANAVARQDVRITLNAKGSNRVGPQTIIDAPAAGASVGSPFFLGGWAADLDSAVDTGVNTVHVWAYPVDAKGNRLDPIFIGPAIYGGARPDVAAVYGDRFGDSGYGIIVNGLAPGTYDIAVFAYSTVVNAFTPAAVVRVTVR